MGHVWMAVKHRVALRLVLGFGVQGAQCPALSLRQAGASGGPLPVCWVTSYPRHPHSILCVPPAPLLPNSAHYPIGRPGLESTQHPSPDPRTWEPGWRGAAGLTQSRVVLEMGSGEGSLSGRRAKARARGAAQTTVPEAPWRLSPCWFWPAHGHDPRSHPKRHRPVHQQVSTVPGTAVSRADMALLQGTVPGQRPQEGPPLALPHLPLYPNPGPCRLLGACSGHQACLLCPPFESLGPEESNVGI